MQQEKLLTVAFFSSQELKMVSCFSILNLGASKQECIIP